MSGEPKINPKSHDLLLYKDACWEFETGLSTLLSRLPKPDPEGQDTWQKVSCELTVGELRLAHQWLRKGRTRLKGIIGPSQRVIRSQQRKQAQKVKE